MRHRLPWPFVILVVLSAFAAGAGPQAGLDDRAALADRVEKLTRESSWTLVRRIPVGFRTFHPQGMVKIGDTFFVSSVEVRVPPKKVAEPADGHDRDTGEGVGHLFKIDADGRRLADVRIGEGTMYHPSGLDFDGRYIWAAAAEYRPNSRSLLYRVDPSTLTMEVRGRFTDHVGAVVRDRDGGMIYGITWGSRRVLPWPITPSGEIPPGIVGAATHAPERQNPSHYVDYQDCKFAGRHRMLCSGVTEIRQTPAAAPFRLGGLELVDLIDGRPIHQVPVLLWTPGGMDMTHNPTWFEATPAGLRGYFMPEDDTSTIYVYDVDMR